MVSKSVCWQVYSQSPNINLIKLCHIVFAFSQNVALEATELLRSVELPVYIQKIS